MMAEDTQPQPTSARNGGMFNEPPKERAFPTAPVTIATVAVLVLIAVLFVMGRRQGGAEPAPNVEQPVAAYAANLALTDIKMSESSSLSGGKLTYIDGHIANHGTATVTAITTQVKFANEQAMPAQLMTQPLNLIRSREPYIDTQAVSAAPIAPGGEADFRLIFESINENWNGQQPEIRITRVSTK